MTKVLEVRNIRKEYEEFTLDNISFSLDKGFVMGLIGQNGSGKTTTIKSIMNLVNLNSGSIEIFGEDWIENEVSIKERIGFVYDDCYAFSDFTLKENKNIISSFYKNWDDDKFNYYIRKFKLKDYQKLKELSKGQKMRFSLSLALSHKAELLILDEPTSGLDPVFRSELLDLLFDLIRDEEISILYSTHITSDLEKLADYITFINDGKVAFTEEKDKLLEEFKMIKGPLDKLNGEIEENIVGLRKSKYNFEGLISNYNLKNIDKSFVVERATLDDIVVYYSKEEAK